MLKKWFRSGSSVSIGIDIGRENICVIVMEKKNAELRILHKLKSKYDIEDSVHQVLRNAAILPYVSSATIVVGISDELVIKKTLQLDVGLNDIEIERCVEENAKSFFPEYYFDFQIIGIHAEDNAKIDVEMVVVDKNDLKTLLFMLKKCGYRVNIIDINTAAVEHAKNYFSLDAIQDVGESYIVSLGLALRGHSKN